MTPPAAPPHPFEPNVSVPVSCRVCGQERRFHENTESVLPVQARALLLEYREHWVFNWSNASEKKIAEIDACLAALAVREPAPPQEKELQKRIDQWRSWAQFVYLGGGVPTDDDATMQTRVCKTHDADVLAVRAELTAARETPPCGDGWHVMVDQSADPRVCGKCGERWPNPDRKIAVPDPPAPPTRTAP